MENVGEVLLGRQVLIVEDETLLAMELEALLMDLGCGVIGPAPNVDQALALLDQQRPDAAILDVNLNGQTVMPVARALTAQGVPFVLTTGYNDTLLPQELLGVTRLRKPIEYERLASTLARLLAPASRS